MHEAAAVGHSNAARSVMLTARQFTEFSRPGRVSITVIENPIIDAVGMFIHDEPTGTGAWIDKIAGLLGPPKSSAVRKAAVLLAVSNGSIHGATPNAASPSRTPLGRANESAVNRTSENLVVIADEGSKEGMVGVLNQVLPIGIILVG